MNYSAKSFKLTKDEFNYLLPAIGRKYLLNSDDRYSFIANDSINDLEDMLNRLAGLYGYFNNISMNIVYSCSKEGSLKRFRDFMGENMI